MASRTNVRDTLTSLSISGFTGVNTEDDSTQIADNQASDCLNIVCTKEIKKRGGYTAVNSTEISGSSGILGLGAYRKTGGSKELLFASHSIIGKINTGTGATTSIITGLTSGEQVIFKQFKNIIVATKASDAPRKYDGSAGALLGGSPPTCKYQEIHKNYHFLAGNATYPSRLYYSNLNDNETWGALDFIDINPDDGDVITGLYTTLDTLVITKKYNVYVLYGDTPTYTEGLTLWRIKKASTSTGAVNQTAIAAVGKTLLYPSYTDGIQSFGGTVGTESVDLDSLTSKLASRDITTTYKTVNLEAVHKSASIIFDYKYICSVPIGSSTYNNFNFVYDLIYGSWYFWDLPASCFCIFETTGKEELYFGDSSKGFIYKYTPNIYTDNGTAISARYVTKDFNLGNSAVLKHFRKFYITMNKSSNYQVDVKPFIDMDETVVGTYTITALGTGFTLGTSILGTDRIGEATSNISEAQIMNSMGHFIKWSFENSNNNETFRIRDLTLFYRFMGVR